MDNVVYTTVARQRGLTREMQTIANNIANASTTGFRRESVIFSEHVKKLDEAGRSCPWPRPTAARSTWTRA